MSAEGQEGRQAITLVDFVRRAATERPDDDVFPNFPEARGGRPGLTFAALDARSRAVAASLQRAGISPGDRALLFYPPGGALVPALFGCLYAGAVSVTVPAPCSADPPAARRLSVLAGCRPAIALASVVTLVPCRALVTGLAGLDEIPWLVTDAISPASAPAWREVTLTPESAALMHWPPGAQAGDEGVTVTHARLLAPGTTDEGGLAWPPWLPLLRTIARTRGARDADRSAA